MCVCACACVCVCVRERVRESCYRNICDKEAAVTFNLQFVSTSVNNKLCFVGTSIKF